MLTLVLILRSAFDWLRTQLAKQRMKSRDVLSKFSRHLLGSGMVTLEWALTHRAVVLQQNCAGRVQAVFCVCLDSGVAITGHKEGSFGSKCRRVLAGCVCILQAWVCACMSVVPMIQAFAQGIADKHQQPAACLFLPSVSTFFHFHS